MATITEPKVLGAPPGPSLYRLSVDQYDRMARAGILGGDDRVELIDGLLVLKMTKNERHIAATRLIQRAIDRALPPGFFTAKEDPIVLVRSEPEPDVAVLRGGLEDYLQRKPTGPDCPLVVEVADSTYAADRNKLALYAEVGIPVCWIANLGESRIEAYREPAGAGGYGLREDFGLDASIPLLIDGREVARLPVRALLPP